MSLFCLEVDKHCDNDAAINVLENIFGSNFIQAFLREGVNPAAATPAASDLAPILLGGLASVAGMLAIVVFFFLLVTSLISSAQDGEAFGKGSAKSIIVLRFLFSVMMLMPTGSGYCLAQIVIMFFVLWSNGETNKFYHNVVEASAISKMGGIKPTEPLPENSDPFGIRGVGLAHFAQAYCVNLLNANYYPESFQPASKAPLTINGVTFNGQPSTIYKDHGTRNVDAGRPSTHDFKEEAGDGFVALIPLIDKGQAITDNANRGVCGNIKIYHPKNTGYQYSLETLTRKTNKEGDLIGLTVPEQREVFKAISAAAYDLQIAKQTMLLQVTGDVSEWMANANLPYNFTSDTNYADALSQVKFEGLQEVIDAAVIKSHFEFERIVIGRNLAQLTNNLVTSLTSSGWTYAGGIKQRIISAQSGVSGSLNMPMVELTKPQIFLLNIEDERYEHFKASMAVLNSAIEKTLASATFSTDDNLTTTTELLPDEFTEDVSVSELNDKIQDSYSNFISRIKRGIVSYLITGSAGSATPAASTNLEANWLNNDKDVLANIQRTGEFIAVVNGAANISFYALKSKAIAAKSASGSFDTVYRLANGAVEFLDKVIGPLFAKFITYLTILQTYMAVVIPSIPYFFFITGVVAWYIHILQAMAGIPFWAIMHMIPERSFAGSQTQGYVTVISLFLRPMLTLTGLFFGFLLANPILLFVTDAFFTMQESLMNVKSGSIGGGLVIGLVEFFTFANWMILYCTLVLQICYMIFGLAGTLPDSVLRWLGSGLNSGGWGESDAKAALEIGTRAGIADTKLGGELRANQAEKGKGGKDNGGGNSPNGGGGGDSPNGGGGGDSPATPTQGGVDDARANKMSSQGQIHSMGAQLSTGDKSAFPSTPDQKHAQNDFMGAGGVIGSDGKPLNNKELWKANSTRSDSAKAGFGSSMVAGYALGGMSGAVKGVGQSTKFAIQEMKDGGKLGSATKAFFGGMKDSIKNEASLTANIIGHNHMAQYGGLPINSGDSTTYTKGGGGGAELGRAYKNLNKAYK